MPIRTRGEKWQADFCHKGRRSRRDFATREEADIWLAELRLKALKSEQLARTRAPQPPAVRLRDALETLADSVWKHQRSYYAHKHNAQKVLDLLGNVPLRSIDNKAIDGLIESLRGRRYAPSTVNRKLATLSRVLHFAEEKGWVERVPTIRFLRVRKSEVRFLSRETEALAIAHHRGVRDPSMADFIEFEIDTGLRLREALAIKVREVSEGGPIVVKGQRGQRTRSVPQTDRVRRVIRGRVAALSLDPSDRLFADLDDRQVHARWARFEHIFGRSGAAADSPNVLRETFIVRAVEADIAPDRVVTLTGLKNLKAVQKYLRFMPIDREAAIAKLDQTRDTESAEPPQHPSDP